MCPDGQEPRQLSGVSGSRELYVLAPVSFLLLAPLSLGVGSKDGSVRRGCREAFPQELAVPSASGGLGEAVLGWGGPQGLLGLTVGYGHGEGQGEQRSGLSVLFPDPPCLECESRA